MQADTVPLGTGESATVLADLSNIAELQRRPPKPASSGGDFANELAADEQAEMTGATAGTIAKPPVRTTATHSGDSAVASLATSPCTYTS